ncbi:RluA family pseudouridine synthase [Candidatus Magnetaquicoccus inordinatus]|uniref:RluA family pseudouridine synthase n=1 Tax=Candidatus Magnetaquicoccus inordinatus TaxID=2496818 RepID=UPI00102D258C|nr:RluA family pseudouridine synthase [Candidatus Magnetaquicoccus inordinatus]
MDVKICNSQSAKRDENFSGTGQQSAEVEHILVSEQDAGMRVDRFLHGRFPSVPYSFLHRLLRTGQVRVNGKRVQGGGRLCVGDRLRLPPVRWQSDSLPSSRPLYPPDGMVRAVRERILWRDEALLVMNKASGMAVHGGSGETWGAIDAMRRLLQWEESPLQPELCHRLDKDTSGCLLFALTPFALRSMAEAFRHGKVEKRYLALVRGVVAKDEGVIDLPLSKGVVKGGERIVVSSSHGAAATTRFQVKQRFANATLLEIVLESGRTHQIRVHLQAIGHPVAGDRKYGDAAFDQRMAKIGLHRLFLHAWKLSFRHPQSAAVIALSAPLEEKLQQFINQLTPLAIAQQPRAESKKLLARKEGD